MGDGDSGFDWNGFLDTLVNTGASVYQTYEQSQTGLTRLPNGSYINGQGVVTTINPYGATNSNQTSLLLIVILAVIGFFAFTKIK